MKSLTRKTTIVFFLLSKLLSREFKWLLITLTSVYEREGEKDRVRGGWGGGGLSFIIKKKNQINVSSKPSTKLLYRAHTHTLTHAVR